MKSGIVHVPPFYWVVTARMMETIMQHFISQDATAELDQQQPARADTAIVDPALAQQSDVVATS